MPRRSKKIEVGHAQHKYYSDTLLVQAELADSGILRDIGLARGRAKMLMGINSTTSSIGGGNVDFEVF